MKGWLWGCGGGRRRFGSSEGRQLILRRRNRRDSLLGLTEMRVPCSVAALVIGGQVVNHSVWEQRFYRVGPLWNAAVVTLSCWMLFLLLDSCSALVFFSVLWQLLRQYAGTLGSVRCFVFGRLLSCSLFDFFFPLVYLYVPWGTFSVLGLQCNHWFWSWIFLFALEPDIYLTKSHSRPKGQNPLPNRVQHLKQ